MRIPVFGARSDRAALDGPISSRVLSVAWMVTTGMAYVAIRNRRFEQHKEWMIRKLCFDICVCSHTACTRVSVALATWN